MRFKKEIQAYETHESIWQAKAGPLAQTRLAVRF